MKNSGAMNYLALHYLKGIGVEKDFEKGRQLFIESAKLGNSNALNFLGNIYVTGKGVPINIKKAREYFQIAIQKGNHIGYIHIGNFYLKGLDVEKNYEKAKEYFELVAKQGISEAFIGLGFLYLIGLGVEIDYVKAKKYFELSVERNNIFADIYIGNLYFYGLGVKRDYEKALEYYKKSLNKGNSKAYNSLGKVYCDINGAPQDFDRAKYYFDLSIINGNPEALVLIGDIYLKIKKNVQKAIEYYNLAAKESVDDAYISLGKLYFYGYYNEKNYKKAKEYFEKAAEKSDSDAFYYLGRIYYESLGVKCDYQKALKYFELSASNDNKKALFYLGLIYENGNGVKVNKDKAIFYYKKCAESHDEISVIFDSNYWNQKTQFNENYFIAKNNLGLLYYIDNHNIELGIEFVKESYFSEYSYSQCNFALISYFTHGKNSNVTYLLELAAKNHNSIAEFIIGHLKEKKNKTQKSIVHFSNSIQYENALLTTWGNTFIIDKRLEISKIFVIFLANLKLTNYYFIQSEPSENSPKKFFINAIFRPIFKLLFEKNNNSYIFRFEIVKNGDDYIITNLYNFILDFPLFNLTKKEESINGWKLIEDQEMKTAIFEFNVKTKDKNDNKTNKKDNILTDMKDDDSCNYLQDEIQKIFCYYNNQNEFESFECKLSGNIIQIQFKSKTDDIIRRIIFPKFFYMFLNVKTMKNEIDSLITQMENILFRPPYLILFGRIPINNDTKNIDENF